MSDIVYSVASGTTAQMQRLEILSNNLANASTAGFKADHPVFGSYLPMEDTADSQTLADGSLQLPDNYHVKIVATRTDYSSGPLRRTDNPLDIALVGTGFFVIQTGAGEQYTRDGQFRLDENGSLVSSDGQPVMGDGGEIRLAGDQVNIDEQGGIWVGDTKVDTIKIVAFDTPERLEKMGRTRFSAPKDVTPTRPEKPAVVKQGHVEQSNVDTIMTMTEMIDTLRAYESYQKAMRSADDTTGKAINEVGRPV
ncbi:MAG: flagellar basal-body rod protein FlgF [Pseudomonadota bacterium]